MWQDVQARWVPGASPLQGSAGDDRGTPGCGWWQEKGAGQGPVLAAHSGLCHGNQLLPGEGAWELHSPSVASLLPGQSLVLRAPIHPRAGGLWAPHPPHHLCECPALTTAGPKPWEWEKQELSAPELLERGVLPCPTHAGAIGHHRAPSSCPRCPGLPVAPTPGRPAAEPIWRL